MGSGLGKCRCIEGLYYVKKCKTQCGHYCICNIFFNSSICKAIRHSCVCLFPQVMCKKHMEETMVVDEICAICLGNMGEVVKLGCNHVYHLRCIKEWIRYRTICP